MTYSVTEFAKRFDYLLKTHGKTAKELTTLLDIPSSSVSDWRKGKSGPKIKTLVGISLIFDVSLDWLILGRETNGVLPADEQMILENYRKMDTFSKGRLYGFAESIFDSTREERTLKDS